MLSIYGEIILCDVNSCSEASVFFFKILCGEYYYYYFFCRFLWKFNSLFLLEPLVFFFFFFNRSRWWVSFLSYFWLETWGSGVGKCEGSGKILVNLPS